MPPADRPIPQRFKSPQRRKGDAKRAQPAPAGQGQYDESKHKRSGDGKFTSGGGGGAAPKQQPQKPAPAAPAQDKKRLRGRKLPMLGLRMGGIAGGKPGRPKPNARESAKLEADHDKRFQAFLSKLPAAKAGAPLSSVESFVWRARTMDDAQLTRERNQVLAAAKKLKGSARATMEAHAATIDYLLKNRARIRNEPKAEKHLDAVHTKNRVDTWNRMTDKDRLRAAKKRAKWSGSSWEGDWPGKAQGYVMYEDGSIGKKRGTSRRKS